MGSQLYTSGDVPRGVGSVLVTTSVVVVELVFPPLLLPLLPLLRKESNVSLALCSTGAAFSLMVSTTSAPILAAAPNPTA